MKIIEPKVELYNWIMAVDANNTNLLLLNAYYKLVIILIYLVI